ncbi:uncharacterized protein ColSpa_04467 [Colletotrichum spaethianum]|uniref:Uncharacterized protein n=1 Tax=Colletotrichum spaethianum TaxID=700344 RepID=A0AA37P5N8_9PEZI|nr:uncharacterized protein ColSpa_04467 [Colletotrichum spaethianum]GKT44286.1 hypothetical protein ColSpa_04467 [Colletotrichum spaethianum]
MGRRKSSLAPSPKTACGSFDAEDGENATSGNDPEEGVGEPLEEDDGDADPPTRSVSVGEPLSLPLEPTYAMPLNIGTLLPSEDGEEVKLETRREDGVRTRGVGVVWAARTTSASSNRRDGGVLGGESEDEPGDLEEAPVPEAGPAVDKR